MKVKDKYIKVPCNTVLDGVHVAIGGKLTLQDGTVIKEATKAQYKKLQKLFPDLFEESKEVESN